MSMKLIIAAAALMAVSLPATAGPSEYSYNGNNGYNGNHNNHYCGCGHEFVKGDSSAARGSIYDMAGHGTCEPKYNGHE